MAYYDEQDDYPEPAGVELVTHPCPVCGTRVMFPTDEYDTDAEFCGAWCVGIACERMRVEYEADRAAELAAYEASLVDAPCVVCDAPCRVPPGVAYHDRVCSAGCRDRLYAELVAAFPGESDIPY